MEYNQIFWILATFSVIFIGLGKGGLPVVALLSVPTLSLIMPTIAAASLLLPIYIVSDFFALFAYRRDFNKDVLKIGILGMTLGVIIGWLTAHIMVEWVVTLCIGLMGVFFSLGLLFKNESRIKDPSTLNHYRGYFWSTITGFTSFISHSGGPPWQIFTLPLGLSKEVFVGTSVLAFTFCNAIKLVPYYFLGQINVDNFWVTIYLAGPASLAVFAGFKLVKIIPEKLFFKIVSYALLLISIKLVWDGLASPLAL